MHITDFLKKDRQSLNAQIQRLHTIIILICKSVNPVPRNSKHKHILFDARKITIFWIFLESRKYCYIATTGQTIITRNMESQQFCPAKSVKPV